MIVDVYLLILFTNLIEHKYIKIIQIIWQVIRQGENEGFFKFYSKFIDGIFTTKDEKALW